MEGPPALLTGWRYTLASLQEKGAMQLGQYLRGHEASVRYRIRTLSQMINDRLVNTRWNALASRIVTDARAKTPMEELSAIYFWTQRMITLQKDPPGFDVFHPPERTILQRFGDCDEHTSMIGLLARSIGYPIKIRAVSMDGLKFSHVYPLADAAKGRGSRRWVALDAVFGRGPGIEPRHEKEMDVRV